MSNIIYLAINYGLQTEPALLYDAVQVLALALASTKDVHSSNVSCESETHISHGKILLENINKVRVRQLEAPRYS